MEFLDSIIDKFLNVLLSALPLSPFQQFLDEFRDMPYMGFLNWFIPVADIVKVLLAWLGAIALFYTYMLIMRWVKLLGD